MAICCCRLAVKIRSYSSLVRGDDIGATGCPTGCCCCCWDIYGGDDSSDNNDDSDSLYKEKQSFSSKLMTSYWLEG